MTLEQAAPGRMHESAATEELDWDAVYADQAPRVYNYFRFRLGREADVEDRAPELGNTVALPVKLIDLKL
jgi:hypothetical protein